jgi:hypothetical protein
VAGEECFLDDCNWQQVQVQGNDSVLMPSNSATYHEGLNLFASVPGLLKKFNSLGTKEPSANRAYIISTAESLRSKMIDWYERLQSESKGWTRRLLLTSPNQRTTFPSVYEYKDIITATFIVHYSAHLVRINKLLESTQDFSSYQMESVTLSKDICLSVAYCAQAGFCGVQAMLYALPIALTTLSEQYADWIRQQIRVFEELQESSKLRSSILEKKKPV